MYCNHCGKEIPKDSAFCRYCGKKLENENDIKTDAPSKKGSWKMTFVILGTLTIIAAITTVVLLNVLEKDTQASEDGRTNEVVASAEDDKENEKDTSEEDTETNKEDEEKHELATDSEEGSTEVSETGTNESEQIEDSSDESSEGIEGEEIPKPIINSLSEVDDYLWKAYSAAIPRQAPMVEIVHDDIRPDGGNWEWVFDERSINPDQDFSQGYFLLDPGEEDEQVFYYFLVAHFSGEIIFEHWDGEVLYFQIKDDEMVVEVY